MPGNQEINYRLTQAVRKGDQQKTRKLINSLGLSQASDWPEGYVLLVEALRRGHATVAKIILTSGCKVNKINTTRCDTPLHLAVTKNYIDIVEMLLNKGGKTNIKNRFGQTPLSCAIVNKNLKATKLFLNHGADVNTTDIYGKTPLHLAVDAGCLQIVESLLKFRAHVNCMVTKGYKRGYTPLHMAVEKDSREMSKLLISKGADINSKGNGDITPLHIAALNGNVHIVKDLLNHGAYIDTITSKKNYTPLHLSIQCEHINVVELLLKYGANVDFKTKNGQTALHFCAKYGCNKIIEIILKSGADVNCTDMNGKTALHIATVNSHFKVVTALLNYGSDINITTKCNHTAFNYAKMMLSNIFFYSDDGHYYYHEDFALNFFDPDDQLTNDSLKISSTFFSNLQSIILTFEHHIIKLFHARFHVGVENLESMDFWEHIPFQNACNDEIIRIKSEKINFKLTFHDIMTKHTSSLEIYMRNKNVLRVLQSAQFETKFPIYGNIIKNRFKKSMERKKILDSSRTTLFLLFRNYVQLPYLCIEMILGYLHEKDLSNLKNVQPSI